MKPPSDLDQLLVHLHCGHNTHDSVASSLVESVLAPEDEVYLNRMLDMLRSGRPAIVIVDDAETHKTKYMYSNCTRAKAVSIMGRVLESTGDRLDK